MEGSITEIEDKVEKILMLIKSKDQEKQDGITGDSERDSELVGLVEDFYNQYQSLHALYNGLRGQSRKRSRSGKGKEGSSSPSSGSDSEYYSSEDIEINNDNLRNSFKKELRTTKLEVTDLKQKFEAAREEKEALKSEYLEALRKIEAAEIVNKSLRDEADEKRRELSAFVKLHEVHGSRASSQIKELEDQLSSLKLELEALHSEKRDLEAQCVSKATEAKQLEEKKIELHAQISELESTLKEKEKEITNLPKKLKDNENNLTSQIEDLTTQVSYLQSEVDSLRAQQNKATDQIKGLRDQVNLMQRDLVSLTSQKMELELLLEGQTKEISEYLIQVKTLKEELAKRTAVEQRMLKEKEGFLVRVKDLELEVESVCNQKNKLEEQIDSRVHEAKLLREERERLHARFAEMEDQVSALQRKYGSSENETSTQIPTLNAQVHNPQQDLDNLQAQKSQLNLKIVSENSSHSLMELEQQNVKLTAKIADQQRILKEQEVTINRLTEDSREVKRRISGSKISLQVAERKMSELAEDFRKKLEDNIRVLYRRILVAEQLHNENKDSYRKIKERLEEENRVLKNKIETHEAGLRKIRDIFPPGNKALSGLDLVVRKLEVFGDSVNRISNISNELVIAKNWVTETNNNKKRLQQEVDCLVEQLDDKEEQETFLREKIWKLEAKLGEQGEEKLNLLKSISQLEEQIGELEKKTKERDEGLLSLGEEKREAIRQLCLFIDYYRTNCNYLKGVISKMAFQSSRTRT